MPADACAISKLSSILLFRPLTSLLFISCSIMSWPAGASGAPEVAPTNTYWISPSTNFDAIMDHLPANATIHLQAGTYETTGCIGWGPKTGQTIIGAGINSTTLRYPIKQSPNFQWLIEPHPPYHQTNITVSDLTLDCNYQPGTFITLKGMCLHGSGNTIERVRLVNAASFTKSARDYRESFGIMISRFPYPSATNNVVKDCIVSNYFCNYANNMSAIGITSDGGQILNNEVVSGGRNYVLATGCIGKGCLVSNNITRGCKMGYHSDTVGGSTNLTVTCNQFLDCACAFFVANSTNYNLNFSSNYITLSNNDPGYLTEGMYFCPPVAFTNVVVAGNSVSVGSLNLKNGAPLPSVSFIRASNVSGLNIHDNSVTAGLGSVFINCAGVTTNNNSFLP
jgi:hypothetical protein